ncbi:MAG TPA: hypothetical protein VEH50_13275 [Methylomirabilota bacterium]|nr:hypothetical protein [Methylomirabilota bacterium]
MRGDCRREVFNWRPVAFAVVIASVLTLSGCKRQPPTDLSPLDQAGMWFSNVQELRGYNLTQAEVSELVEVRQAGLNDENCLELVRLARGRHQSFSDGDAIASLLDAGLSSQTIMELARLNQLGPWAGEALAMHLAKLTDAVVLDVAGRRASGQPVLSGEKLAELRDAGYKEAQLIDLIERGTTDEQADRILEVHNRASGRGFVRQRGRR